jgi:hypothetical protein
MSFLRHGEIYRPISSCGSKPEQPWLDCPGAHRYDEFPAGYSLAGCAPAEPVSALPAGVHRAVGRSGSTIEMQRTARSVLTACLTQGDNPRLLKDRNGTGMLPPQGIFMEHKGGVEQHSTSPIEVGTVTRGRETVLKCKGLRWDFDRNRKHVWA